MAGVSRHRRPPSSMAGDPMKRQVACSSSLPPTWALGRRSRSTESCCLAVVGGARQTEKTAMRITVVDIDLMHGRPADVHLSTHSLSTDSCRHMNECLIPRDRALPATCYSELRRLCGCAILLVWMRKDAVPPRCVKEVVARPSHPVTVTFMPSFMVRRHSRAEYFSLSPNSPSQCPLSTRLFNSIKLR